MKSRVNPGSPLTHPSPLRGEGNQRRQLDLTLVIVALVLLGVALRLVQYFWQQSFWNDEAFLVVNIFTHGARDLLGPLDYNQASPPLFLLAMRGIHVMLGRSELAMRLLPVLLSIGAVIVFAILVVRILPQPVAAIILALFAISNQLITHAVEAKQYSGDVLVATLLILLATFGAPQAAAHRRLERASLLACVAVWFSHPAAFVFGGIALALGGTALRARRVSAARVIAVIAAPALSFVVLYVLSIRQQQSQVLFNYWDDKFVDYSWRMPWWLLRSCVSLFDYGYEYGGVVLLPLGIIGAIQLWRDGRRELLGILVFPILLTLIAAAMRRYPFGGTRLTLFLAPACLLLAGVGLADVRTLLIPRFRLGWMALVIGLLALNGAIAAYHLVVPRYRGNMRPVIEYIRAHRKPDEPVFALRRVEVLAYWSDPDDNVVLGNWPKRFPREGRFWVALSVGQGPSKLQREMEPLLRRGLGDPLSCVEWRGGAALFFDRSIKPAKASPNPLPEGERGG